MDAGAGGAGAFAGERFDGIATAVGLTPDAPEAVVAAVLEALEALADGGRRGAAPPTRW